MTWSAFIADKDGNAVDCGKCMHVAGCAINRAAPNIGYLLTSIDNCCDGTMAAGSAELKCVAYEEHETPQEGEKPA